MSSVNQVLGAGVLHFYGDDGTHEFYDHADNVGEAQAHAKQLANDYDPDNREFSGPHDTWLVVTFDEGGKFKFEEVTPDEGKGHNRNDE